MERATDLLLVLIILLGLGNLLTVRPFEGIRLTGVQGLALAAIVLTIHHAELNPLLLFLAALTFAVKGLLIPWFFIRAVPHDSGVAAVKPYLSHTLSLLLGVVAVGAAFWIASLLPQAAHSRLVVPVSLSAVFIGLLLLVSRKTAANQVVGYLVLENGIFVFSFALANQLPSLVEMGILLDLFVAVFIMGITIYQIRQEFDHIDTSQLRELHDLLRPLRTEAQTAPGARQEK